MNTTATHIEGLDFTAADIERFWSYVDRSDGPDACHPWKGWNHDGYGRFGIRQDGRPKNRQAHRIAYTLTKGAIPRGLTLDHLAEVCARRDCCNPSHLEPVTNGDNTRRKSTITKVDHLARAKARPEWADTKRREIYEFIAANPAAGVEETKRAIRGTNGQLLALIGELVDRAALVSFVADHGTAKELYVTGRDDILDLLYYEDIAAEAARKVAGLEFERAADSVNDDLIRDHLDAIVSYVRRNPGAGVEETGKALDFNNKRTGSLLADLRASGNIIRAERLPGSAGKLAHYFVPSTPLDVPKRSKATMFSRATEADAA